MSILLPILPQRQACSFFETCTQMTLGGKAKVGCNITVGVSGVNQHIFCQFDFLLQDK